MMISEPKCSTGNVLIDLRIVILRVIASVWSDDQNKPNKLISTQLTEAGFHSTHLAQIQEDLKYFKSYIGVTKSLREILTNMDAHWLDIYFQRKYKYKMPFDSFGIQFIKGSAIWNSYGDEEWTKPEDEIISLTLPSIEAESSAYQSPEFLMDFYSHFPNFFGAKRGIYTDDIVITPPNPSDLAGADFSGNDYNLGVAEDDFLGFGALTNKIIAVAWNNKTFKEKIDYESFKLKQKNKFQKLYEAEKSDKINDLGTIKIFNEEIDKKIDEQYFKDIAFILKDHFDFEMPWAFHLKLQFADAPSPVIAPIEPIKSNSPFWEKLNGEWTWVTSKKRRIIRNTVSLEIPAAPDSKTDNVSLALARYNLIGPAYPFTCS